MGFYFLNIIIDFNKFRVHYALWRIFDRFTLNYIRKKGFLDGFVGFMQAYMSALYQIVSYAKYRELKNNSHTD